MELENRRNELRSRGQSLAEQLRGLLEQRGRLGEQLDALKADRRLASKQLDLAVVEKRLEDAVRRWQVLAATSAVLDSIRSAYETSRQPEALQEASEYLKRLTQGRYLRVWAPLGEHALRVERRRGTRTAGGSPEPGHAGTALPEPPPGAGRLVRPPRRAAAAGARRRAGELRRRPGKGRRRRAPRLRRGRPPAPGVHLPRTHHEAVPIAQIAGHPPARQHRAGPDHRRARPARRRGEAEAQASAPASRVQEAAEPPKPKRADFSRTAKRRPARTAPTAAWAKTIPAGTKATGISPAATPTPRRRDIATSDPTPLAGVVKQVAQLSRPASRGSDPAPLAGVVKQVGIHRRGERGAVATGARGHCLSSTT